MARDIRIDNWLDTENYTQNGQGVVVHPFDNSPLPPATDFGISTISLSGIDRLQRIADIDGAILILGERGTGKSTLARKIYETSSYRKGPFIRRGCGEFESGTLKAQLFGHAKGAFTGAVSPLRGLLETADHGTLVLDDIDYLPRDAQSSLLRFLDDGVYTRVGEPGKDHRADVRLIFTSNKNLNRLAEQGQFLPDLLNRIQRWPIVLSPLRDEPRRVRELAQAFLAEFSAGSGGSTVRAFSGKALDLLCALPWPGNIRELRHAVENLALLNEDKSNEITARSVARLLIEDNQRHGSGEIHVRTTRQAQDERIHRVLVLTSGNIAMASRILGCSRTTIYARVRANGWQLPR